MFPTSILPGAYPFSSIFMFAACLQFTLRLDCQVLACWVALVVASPLITRRTVTSSSIFSTRKSFKKIMALGEHIATAVAFDSDISE